MGKRRAVCRDDRPALDPIFGLNQENCIYAERLQAYDDGAFELGATPHVSGSKHFHSVHGEKKIETEP